VETGSSDSLRSAAKSEMPKAWNCQRLGLEATAGEALGRVCKPEVTGSIPVRSTERNSRKYGGFLFIGAKPQAEKRPTAAES
jgi:hypothetical protein